MNQKKTIIQKGSPKFLRAFDTVEQIEAWLSENSHQVGVAFTGRSNVGKSSLINTLFGNKTAKTSKTPGRTQAINIFSFKLNDDQETSYLLYDLPGYGHAEVSKQMAKNWNYLMASFFNLLAPSTLVMNIQDARHPDQKSDQAFYQFINPEFLKINLVFNKIDKLKKQKERAALNKLKPQLIKNYEQVREVFFVSAESRQGVEPLEDSIVNHCKTFSER